MRFTLLVSFVIASPILRRSEAGLLDGVLNNNSDDYYNEFRGGNGRNRGLLGSGGLLGTGIGSSRGLLGTRLLGNKGLGLKHHGHDGNRGSYIYQNYNNYGYSDNYDNYGYY